MINFRHSRHSKLQALISYNYFNRKLFCPLFKFLCKLLIIHFF